MSLGGQSELFNDCRYIIHLALTGLPSFPILVSRLPLHSCIVLEPSQPTKKLKLVATKKLVVVPLPDVFCLC